MHEHSSVSDTNGGAIDTDTAVMRPVDQHPLATHIEKKLKALRATLDERKQLRKELEHLLRKYL